MLSGCWLLGSICICIVCVWLFQCAHCVGTREIVGLMKRPVSDRHQSDGGGVDDVFCSIICHWVVLTPWGQSLVRWWDSNSHFCLSLVMHVSFVRFLSLPASPLLSLSSLVSQPRSSLLRRCFSAIMNTGGSTRLLHWSWAASWAQRLAGGLMHTQIKLET